MKKILLFTSLVLALCSTAAYADSLEFEWTYTDTAIDGFRLYRNGIVVDTDAIDKAARTVIVPRQTDKQDHSYHLVAYRGPTESGPSASAIDRWEEEMLIVVPGFTMRVIKGN